MAVMDPVSQAAFGAAWAQSGARNDKVAPATIVGCLAGVAADADVLIQSTTDPLLFLEYHRHFTHSLLFIPIGGLICAAVFHWFTRRRLSFAECLLFSLLGYASHGVLDACTTYGTLLLWPLSDERFAWDYVSVVDPAFTLPVIVFTSLAYRYGRAGLGRLALGWAVGYLAIGALQNHRAMEAGAVLAASRGHVPVAARVMPSIANLVLWRHIYEHDGRFFVDAVRVGATTQVFEGSSLAKFDRGAVAWLDPTSTQALDVQRFQRFAEGYVGLAADEPNRLIDLRYSALPNGVTGIWSVELDPAAGRRAHVRFTTSRAPGDGGARALLDMLLP